MATLTHAELAGLWITAGGIPGTADTAAAIAQAESGGCQYAKAGPTDDRPVKQCVYRHTLTENSYGLWQINRMAHPQYSATTLWNPLGNAQAAVDISNGGDDFGAWTTYTNGAYKQYLQAGGVPTPQPGSTAPPTAAGAAPSGHRGYADLRNSVAKHLPTQLRTSRRQGAATLRLLGSRSKVKGR